jgi:hypothetical protein
MHTTTTTKTLLLAIPIAALALTGARDASACGGCFTQQAPVPDAEKQKEASA